MGRNCIEMGLHYIYIEKRVYGKKTTWERDYIKKKLYREKIQGEGLYRRDYNIQKGDYTWKRLHRKEQHKKGYIT